MIIIQLEKLKNALKWQYENTPFNRKRFEKAGVKPEDIQSFEDFSSVIPPAGQAEIGESINEVGFDMDKLMIILSGREQFNDFYLLTTTSDTTYRRLSFMLDEPPPRVAPPMKLKAEFTEMIRTEDLPEIEKQLSEKMHTLLKIRPEIIWRAPRTPWNVAAWIHAYGDSKNIDGTKEDYHVQQSKHESFETDVRKNQKHRLFRPAKTELDLSGAAV